MFLGKFLFRFLKACFKGLKGFAEFIKELLQGFKNGAKAEDLVDDIEPEMLDEVVVEGGKRKVLTSEERVAFRKSNKIIKKIEGELDNSRKLYQKERAGLDYRKVKNHWYYGKLADRIKKSELTIDEARMLAKLKTGVAETTNIAKGEMEILHNGKKVFSKKEYWSSASERNLLNNGKGIEKSVENVDSKFMFDTGSNPKRFRKNDSEIKITSLMDEDIAKIATELGINPKDLEIKTKILTTYDPCNVCKRDILSRSIIYPKSSFEIVRPMYRNDKNIVEPVFNYETFKKFLKQKNLTN